MKQNEKDFEFPEKAYKIIFRNFPNPLYIWKKVGKDLILVAFNEASFKITQGGIEKYHGIKASELYKQNPTILEDLNNCFNQKTSFYKKLSYKFKSTNKIKTLLVFFNFIPPDLVLIYTQDKTAEEEAELALKNSEREKALILESISEVISLQDLNHNVIWMNRPASKLIGLNQDELKGKKCYEIWYNKQNPCEDCPVEKTIQTKKVEESEINTIDGEVWTIRVFPVKNEQDKIIGIVEIAQNITEKKKAKQALKESEQKFRLINDQSLIGICILQDDIYKYVNEQFLQIIGYSREEIKDWKPGDYLKIIHPDYRDFIKIISEKRKSGKTDYKKHWELKGVRKNGEEFWGEIYTKPITFKGHTADLITTIDITERKNTELKLRESEKNYQIAYNRAEFYKDIFAHDINNILQNIRSASDLLEIYQKDRDNTRNEQEMIDIINSQVSRGANLVSNIRKLSQLEKTQISLKLISVKDMLFKAVSAIKDIYSVKIIEIYIDQPESEIKVFANEFLLDIFKNILYNSIEFNDNDIVKIDIVISKINHMGKTFIQMQFIDNGIGINDERKEKIFERSFSNKEKGKGMGLGLSLVRKILEAYQATIKVENRIKDDYRKGSNFIILFPEKIEKS